MLGFYLQEILSNIIAFERGDALRIIQKYGGVKPARIGKIQRQKVEGYKKSDK